MKTKLKKNLNVLLLKLETRFYPQLNDSFAISSHLTIKERIAIYRLAKKKRTIVEIGSYLGASACCFGAALSGSGGQVFCIDTWKNDAMSEGGKDTFEEFSSNTAKFKHVIVPVRGLSTEVASILREKAKDVDVLFIDGDHSYDGVRADWETYKGFLAPGSIVIFHDYGWAEGVKRVIHEEVLPRVTGSGQLPNLWWGIIK
jgi:predicted O-methyltransferase YrrM